MEFYDSFHKHNKFILTFNNIGETWLTIEICTITGRLIESTELNLSCENESGETINMTLISNIEPIIDTEVISNPTDLKPVFIAYVEIEYEYKISISFQLQSYDKINNIQMRILS